MIWMKIIFVKLYVLKIKIWWSKKVCNFIIDYNEYIIIFLFFFISHINFYVGLVQSIWKYYKKMVCHLPAGTMTWMMTLTHIRYLFCTCNFICTFVWFLLFWCSIGTKISHCYVCPNVDWYQIVLDRSGEIKGFIERIKAMLSSFDDGDITISAYDTAWVALVKDVSGSGRPQFPSSLEWIVNNQLPDGSWGDHLIFLAHDRLSSTLACIIALTSWNIHPSKCEKGKCFFKM